ncbi:MAG: alkaline phosphatase family protein [Bacteroidota bacterium]|nr:alkaline phosphatase family protein [Bacteroidota bacterium]
MKKLFFLFIPLIFISCNKDSQTYEQYGETTIDSTKIDRKVLIIGIDGFRSDVLLPESTPFMHSMFHGKNIYYNSSHIVEHYTVSGPNWSSILTGVHYNKHNIVDNSFSDPNYLHFPPFFRYIEDIQQSINTASIVNWEPINTHILSSHVDYSNSEPNDSLVFLSVKKLLVESDPISPDVLFLQFDELDGAGHSYGFSSSVPEYVNKLSILDSYVQNLFGMIQEKRHEGEDWMIFIVSDHGGDGTSHSDNNNPHIKKTILLSEHPSISYKEDYISSQADLSPTILSFLGIFNTEFNYKTDGNLIFFADD